MIQSMTGYAEKRFDSRNLSAKISIKTLNHRFFDWYYRGIQIGNLEQKLRAICQRKLQRGRVEVSLELLHLDSSRWEFWFNEDLLRDVLTSMEKVLSKGKSRVNLSIDNVFAIPHAVEVRRKDFTKEELASLEKHFKIILEEVINARLREGRQLKREIQSHVKNIKRATSKLTTLVKRHAITIREKLEQRLKELNQETTLAEEKMAEEAAYIAQRYDLSEEVTRIKSHVSYVEELLASESVDPVGKKLDFMAQEIYREANTINSKAQDIKTIKESLAIKSEIESVRQHVQNIE